MEAEEAPVWHVQGSRQPKVIMTWEPNGMSSWCQGEFWAPSCRVCFRRRETVGIISNERERYAPVCRCLGSLRYSIYM